MKANTLKIDGISVTEYEPAVATKNTILFLHGTGGASKDEGMKLFCKTNEVPAWVYCPSWGGGWWAASTTIKLIDYILKKHGLTEIDILTGLSSGGNGVYTYLTQTMAGHNKVKNFVAISINSRSFASMIPKCAQRNVVHYHGAKDSSPNAVSESETFITEYNRFYPGKAKRTVFSNLGHNAWDTVYSSKLNEPTVTGNAPLYTPFSQSIYDWGLTAPPVVVVEPEPTPDPVIELILEQWVEEGYLYTKTSTGSVYKIPVIKMP